MRQVALAVILAQAGGFVPARSARIGLVDRIYTRVGASDNLARGESTFMVEMRETANILRGATRRSLVILDEIGRGTSTYDGLAIAWAVAEHLHDAIGCRALFATHYHELSELAQHAPARRELQRRRASSTATRSCSCTSSMPGRRHRSYGVAVAQLAGVPRARARARARDARELESGARAAFGRARLAARREARAAAAPARHLRAAAASRAATPKPKPLLRALDVDRMTPVEALVALARLKQLLPPQE